MERYKSISVFLLRIVIGWHLLYEGLTKLFLPAWSAEGFLKSSYGFMSGIFHALANDPTSLQIINVLNVWGLILIGTGLFLGIFIRISTVAGIVLLMLYYFAYPPFGNPLASPSEGHLFIVDKLFIETAALIFLFFYSEKG